MPLYSFGSNSDSQLSLNHTYDVSVPTECHFATPPPQPTKCPIAFASGGGHTLLLFDSGAVYAAGRNAAGQCGIPVMEATKRIDTFTLLPYPPECEVEADAIASRKWGFITAGWEFSILITADGKRAFSTGAGLKGELGLGQNVKSTEGNLCLILNFPPANTVITGLTSSITHAVTILSTGEAYGWGISRKGQLGLQECCGAAAKPLSVTWAPICIPALFGVASAACTKEATYLLSKPNTDGSRDHVVLGSDKWSLRSTLPPSNDGYNPVLTYASWGGFYVQREDGVVVAWGRGDKGQMPPSGLKDVRMMAVGSEHGIAVIGENEESEGKLVTWGWGEHGNCGRVDGDGKGMDVVGELWEVKVPPPAASEEHEVGRKNKRMGKIRTVGAGCATSWVWVDWE